MMLGWYLDALIGYLIRSVIRWVRFRNADEWAKETAFVSTASTDGLYGGPAAKIAYTYTHNGEYFAGTHSKGFLLSGSAEDYAARFWPGSQLVIRVKPGQPEISFIRDEDQTTLKLQLCAL